LRTSLKIVMGLEKGDPAFVVTSTESERGASGWVFWVLIRFAITSFYVLYLGCPEIDILLGEYGGHLDMYALLPGFSRYPKVE